MSDPQTTSDPLDQTITFSKTVGESDVYLFSGITGDLAPVHVDQEFMKANSPYGERIAPKGQGMQAAAREGFEGGSSAGDFFGALASHWKRHYAGWTACLLSPDMKLPGAMRLKASLRLPLWNGPIECRLFRFDLVAGSARTPRPPAGD